MHYFVTIVYNVTLGNAFNFLGYGNRISFSFGLKTSFEMSEGRLNMSFFSRKQIISYSKGIVLVNLLRIR